MWVVSAVLYSGRKLKLVLAHVARLVFAKPFAELATMWPEVDVVRSLTSISSATPLSLMVTTMLSPGFMSRVLASGVNVAEVWEPGAAGPVGTPFFWMKAKLIGSKQLLFWVMLSMVNAAHQCV